jgi:hypothetical protein
MSLYKQFFTPLLETKTTPFVLGYVRRKDPVGVLDARITDDDDDKHAHEWSESGITWRYIPELSLLTFWEKPTKEELMQVKDWLEKNHYKIKTVRIYGNSIKTIKVDPNIPSWQRDQQAGIAESKNFVYCGVKLDQLSHNKLIEAFKDKFPSSWSIKAHHMTIDPKSKCKDDSLLGQSVNLMVTAFGISDKACAVKVVGYKGTTNNKFPHVTIAVNENDGGKSKDSTKIINWIPIMEHITLTGTIENITSYSNTPLSEAPIKSYTPIGFEPNKKGKVPSHSFQDPRDRELIVHPLNIQKITDMFQNTDYDFDLYFVNKKGIRQFAERGKIKPEFIFNPYPNGLGLDPSQLKDGKINTDHITIFYVGNSAAEKVPMTAWTIAHRIGHAIRNDYAFAYLTDTYLKPRFKELLSYYNVRGPVGFYDREYIKSECSLFNKLGTMRSARENKINRPFEFYYELFAQFLTSGKITLNRLPVQFKIGKYIRNTKEIDYVNEIVQDIENTFPYYANDALSECVGNIYIM